MLTPNFLSEKFTAPHLVKKPPTFFGTRNSIAVFVRPLHLSVSSARWIQCTRVLPFWLIHFNIILPSACRYSKQALSIKFSSKTLHAFFFTTMHAIARPSSYLARGTSREATHLLFCQSSLTSVPSGPVVFLSTLFSNTISLPAFSPQFYGHMNDGLNCSYLCF